MKDKKEDEIYCPECGKAIKRKIIAVILAIFFSIFTWVYTWKRDKYKFFIAIGVMGLMFYCELIIELTTIGATWIFTHITLNGIIIWAILDSATKPRSFYENYPKG